ncbi:MAG: hypothetical protein AAEI08_04795 [Gammaproteobacteria bacterium]
MASLAGVAYAQKQQLAAQRKEKVLERELDAVQDASTILDRRDPLFLLGLRLSLGSVESSYSTGTLPVPRIASPTRSTAWHSKQSH